MPARVEINKIILLHGRDAQSQNIFGVKSRVESGQVRDCPHQQPGADQQDDGEDDLQDGGGGKPSALRAPDAAASPAAAHPGGRVRLAGAKSRQDARKNRSQKRQAKNHAHHRPANGHHIQARNGKAADSLDDFDDGHRQAASESTPPRTDNTSGPAIASENN